MSRRRQQEVHTFSRVPSVTTKRSAFDRSHGYKTTFDAGFLIPFYCDEVVPGDTHKLQANMFCRLATVQKPIMDNLYLETFFFFVPFRLLWQNWQKMWGEQDNPNDSTDYLVPIVQAPPGISASSLTIWDYLGVPVGVPDLYMSALYPRAYNMIWNEWFRDQNLQNSVPEEKGDTDDPANYTLLRRGKRHDYFTSCLPWPQKGPEVLLPLGGTAPVNERDPNASPTFNVPATAAAPLIAVGSGAAGQLHVEWTASAPFSGTTPFHWGDPNLVADLANAGAATINEFRQAVVIQQFYETLARGGSRYVELLQSVYGVTNGDARLQRPEYLGGGRTPITVNPVVNTAGSDTTPQANLAGYGVASSRQGDAHAFTKSFTEHGVIMGMLCVRADLNYQNGMPRQYTRRSKFDFLIPHFANLGEQAVLNREIYAQGQLALNPATNQPWDEEVFGYVSRYDDYRYKPSVITGLFRSNVTSPEVAVDYWHLAQDFATLPTLSPAFIEENPPVARVVAVPEEPHFLLDSWLALQSVRELPTYSVPGIRRV